MRVEAQGRGPGRASRIARRWPPDVRDRTGGVDRRDELLALEDLDERPGLLVALRESDGERLGIVVGPGDEASLADVTDVRLLGPMGHQVVVEAALFPIRGGSVRGDEPWLVAGV